MTTKINLFLGLTLAMYLMTGCGDGTSSKIETDSNDSTMSARNSDTSMDKKMNMADIKSGMMASMNPSMDKMGAMKMSGDFDKDFATMMIDHHQGAIDMSEEELKAGKDDNIKAIAEKIISSQKGEQKELGDILSSYKPMKMSMANGDQLSKLMDEMKSTMASIKMSGNTDKDFSMMMITHHESAVKMAQAELRHGMNSKLKSIAKKEIDDQTKEIHEFKSWLGNK